jgi:hypothetical protein
VITPEEARGLAGRIALYRYSVGREPVEVVLTGEADGLVSVRWRDSSHSERALPGSLTLVPGEESQYVADPVTASQACLNELVAALIRAAQGNSRHAEAAIRALREHSWAAGLPFEGTHPEGPGDGADVPGNRIDDVDEALHGAAGVAEVGEIDIDLAAVDRGGIFEVVHRRFQVDLFDLEIVCGAGQDGSHQVASQVLALPFGEERKF